MKSYHHQKHERDLSRKLSLTLHIRHLYLLRSLKDLQSLNPLQMLQSLISFQRPTVSPLLIGDLESIEASTSTASNQADPAKGKKKIIQNWIPFRWW